MISSLAYASHHCKCIMTLTPSRWWQWVSHAHLEENGSEDCCLVGPVPWMSSSATEERADWAWRMLVQLMLLGHIQAHLALKLEKVLALSNDCKYINVVVPRGDGVHTDGKAVRPWSLHPGSYANLEEAQPFCWEVDDLLASLQLGIRTHAQGDLSDLEMEKTSLTSFLPNTCSFKWYSSEEICQILSRFSQVRLLGDSFLRHVGQALFMLLRDDYKYGGLPLLLGNPRVYDSCRCDGQFSEHALCRFVEGMSFTDHRQYGVCPGTPVQPFAVTYTHSEHYTLELNQSACAEDSRPIFILISGGSHYKHDATQTVQEVVEPVMAQVREARLACPHMTIHVAWMGMGAQSRSLDDRYPHQRREWTASFNDEIAQYWLEKHNVKTFDVWNLTKNAPTSDGYHHLSDVNIVKALYVLNYMLLEDFLHQWGWMSGSGDIPLQVMWLSSMNLISASMPWHCQSQ